MKIIPVNFEENSEIIRKKIELKECIDISSVELNNAISLAYGWSSYDDMIKNIKENDNSLFLKELNLNLDEEKTLVTKKLNEISLLCLRIMAKDENNTDNLDYTTVLRLFLIIKPFISKNLYDKEENYAKLNILPLDEERLRVHSIISENNYKDRIRYILALIKNKKSNTLSIQNSLWIINKSEYEIIYEHILFLKESKFDVSIIKVNEKTSLEIDFKNLNKESKKHYFYVFPDSFSKDNSNSIKLTPNSIIEKLKKEIEKYLELKDFNSNPIDVIDPNKRKLNLSLYLNSDIFNLDNQYCVFLSQARCFGIASIIGIKNIKEFSLNNDIYKNIILNSNNKIININETFYDNLLLGDINKKEVEKISEYIYKNKDISSIAKLSIGVLGDYRGSIVFLNNKGEIHSLLDKVFLNKD